MKAPRRKRPHASKVPLLRNTKEQPQQQQPRHRGNYDHPGNSDIRQAIMAYRAAERLAIPKQLNKLQNEMLITAKESSIASKSQLKGHAHHYFLSPNRNQERGAHQSINDDTASITGSEISEMKHADSLVTLTALLPDDDGATAQPGSETSRSLPADHFTQASTRDRLPAIVPQQRKLAQMRSQKDNSWLGPPNSMPPNKRSEHVAAYKTKPTRTASSPDEQEYEANDVQSESETINEKPALLMDRFPMETLYHPYNDGDDSSASLYPSEASESGRTFSIGSETHFTQLRLIDKPFGKHFSSPGTSLQMKSLAASHTHRSSTRYDDASDNYSSHGYIRPYGGDGLSDTESVTSVMSQGAAQRKHVHFDPQVRDVTRENRAAPLVPAMSSAHTDATITTGVHISLNMASTTDSIIDSLPAVVEKFMIKSLPVLPRINANSINLNNANIIYIKDGKTPVTGQISSITRPVFIQKHNVINPSVGHRLVNKSPRSVSMTSSRVSSQSGGGGATRVYNPHKSHHQVTAVPQLSRVAEESSVASSSPSPQLKAINKTAATKVTTNAPPPSKGSTSTTSSSSHAATATNTTHNTSQYPSTVSTSNTQQTKTANSKKVLSKKIKTDAAKKATSTKSKGKARKGRSSGSSSRNSPSVDSPINDAADEAEQCEQRQHEYAAAMLAVQQRMREFDLRYGKHGSNYKIEEDKDSSWFGKVIPPKSSNNTSAPKPKTARK